MLRHGGTSPGKQLRKGIPLPTDSRRAFPERIGQARRRVAELSFRSLLDKATEGWLAGGPGRLGRHLPRAAAPSGPPSAPTATLPSEHVLLKQHCTVRRNMPPVGVPLETSTRVTLFAQLQCFCQEYYKTLSFFPKYQSCPEPHKACCHHQAILGMDFDSLPLMLSGLSHSALINEQGLSHPRALIICS